MGRLRTVLALAASASAMGLLAGPAIAAPESEQPEFTASKINGKAEPFAFPLKLKGVGVGPQEMVFKKIRVVCERASVSGEIPSSPSMTITLKVAFKECLTGPIIIFGKHTMVPMLFKGKLEFVQHFNGWVASEEEVLMKAKHLGCLVNWDSGTYPEVAEEKPLQEFKEAFYETQEVPTADIKHFPSGMQQKLLVTESFDHIEWEEEGGGLCEDLELVESEHGKYTGKLAVEVAKGNVAH